MSIALACAQTEAAIARARSLFGGGAVIEPDVEVSGALPHAVRGTAAPMSEMSGQTVDQHRLFVSRSEGVVAAFSHTDTALTGRLAEAATATESGSGQIDTIAAQAGATSAAAATATSPAAERAILTALQSQIARTQDVVDATSQQATELATRTTLLDYPTDNPIQPLDEHTDGGDGSGMDPDRKHFDELPGQGAVPPFMPSPYDTPNCTEGEVLGIQGNIFVSGLQLGAALTAAPTGLGTVLLPFEIRDFWNDMTGAKDAYDDCLGK